MSKLLAIFTALALTCAPLSAYAAIALDAATAGSQTDAQNISWSHTVTGSNTVLLVCITGDTTADAVTAVTYNSVAMTRLASVSRSSAGSNGRENLYYLLNPTADGLAHTISVTGTVGTGLFGNSVSYTGVSQSTTFSNATSSSLNSATTITGTLTGVVATSWTFLCGYVGSQAAIVAGSGSTQRENHIPFLGDSNGTVSGTVNMSYTWSSSAQSATQIMIEIPVVAASSQSSKLSPLMCEF